MFRLIARHIHEATRQKKKFPLRKDHLQKFSSYWCFSKEERNKNGICTDGFHTGLQTIKAGLVLGDRKSFTTSHYRQLREDNKTRTLTVWSDLKQLKASPVPALTLGLSGLIPFIAAPAYMISSGVFVSSLAFAQTAYGACILSFIGGTRWGFTLYAENPVQPDWVNLGYSVVPSLIAWCGLLLPAPLSNLSLIGGLTLAVYVDMAMYGYPSWFKGLRFVLSMVAILSLWTSFMCSLTLQRLSSNNEEKKSVTKES